MLLTLRHLNRPRSRMILRQFAMAGLFFLFLLLGPGFGAEPEHEAKVKSAYIYNFTKFVGWKALKNEPATVPLKVCVLGTNAIASALGEIATLKAQGRSIQVTYLAETTDALRQSHILVICRSEQDRLPHILRQLQGSSVLTVSDIPQFAKKGGMIGLFTDQDRVKIEINLPVVRQAGLDMSAKLLEVAKLIE